MPRVVLVYPQIPPNTGNIARTCAATDTELHLVGPLGFEISDRYLKRAGLDYWPHVKLHYHPTLEIFQAFQRQQPGRVLGYSISGKQNFSHFKYEEDDWLMFGSETNGLPKDLLASCDATLRIPMRGAVRSLNLAVSAAVALYEAHRQLGYLDD
ncbi:MAG TPA: tRNA (uridine(34)/cytosine(34)/5-carboxymethylaminomethyluridine(34)-2'-O)-methyltransferase TrmL [Leptolyngbyaceae cyanobacterium M33_DOE_097]|uniref:Putative tRNA (cytidine(34)-2'-O)-methyltransferase n=1 Tax=Oscillatoriales cyanobacterium SpSt-418 TaxID=2282169 RepID=A0A7C3KGM5_9CYAN|nr:tRNA (uridine(34)/cytosine(34)/5-carboxymethylaminomethyluridine(34)-2'-O)-methyltransferase TrmL [Leptolyngbyaceae cyanobacterium M33_DOE_097]